MLQVFYQLCVLEYIKFVMKRSLQKFAEGVVKFNRKGFRSKSLRFVFRSFVYLSAQQSAFCWKIFQTCHVKIAVTELLTFFVISTL